MNKEEKKRISKVICQVLQDVDKIAVELEYRQKISPEQRAAETQAEAARQRSN